MCDRNTQEERERNGRDIWMTEILKSDIHQMKNPKKLRDHQAGKFFKKSTSRHIILKLQKLK